MSKLSDNLREIRTYHKLTREDVANHLDITYTSYSKYETAEREPNVEKLIKLANLFDVTVDYLIGRSEAKTSETTKIIVRRELDKKIDDITKSVIESFIANNKEQIKEEVMNQLKE